jgi:hypothetical protein
VFSTQKGNIEFKKATYECNCPNATAQEMFSVSFSQLPLKRRKKEKEKKE